LDGLISLLVSPGVLPIIRELAVAGRRGCRDLSATVDPPLDDRTLRTALGRLTASGLVVISYTDRAPDQCPQVDCALTASGENLLAPLAGLATWYRHNQDQLAPDQPAAESANLAGLPVNATQGRQTAFDAPNRGARRAHRRERGDVQAINPPGPPRTCVTKVRVR
jgi:DNA-binding HxlR family transcriptional regulator